MKVNHIVQKRSSSAITLPYFYILWNLPSGIVTCFLNCSQGGIFIKYSFGFSWNGFLIVLLPMIPNIFYFLFPDAISSGRVENSHLTLDLIEHGSQIIYITLLIFIITNKNVSLQSVYVIAMAIFLLSYYILWILLFAGNKDLIILICMAIFPVVYFILAEIWLRNFLAIIPTVIFGIVHVIITYKDFLSTH